MNHTVHTITGNVQKVAAFPETLGTVVATGFGSTIRPQPGDLLIGNVVGKSLHGETLGTLGARGCSGAVRLAIACHKPGVFLSVSGAIVAAGAGIVMDGAGSKIAESIGPDNAGTMRSGVGPFGASAIVGLLRMT